VARRYFEIIISSGQLAALIALVVLLLAVVFGLGVAVQLFEPQAASTAAVGLSAPTWKRMVRTMWVLQTRLPIVAEGAESSRDRCRST
jgi:hypothetical protein